MSFKVSTTAEFESDAKILQKRHRSFKNDLKDLIISLEENPFQGVELSPGIRKIRMAIASKGRGKSGGARVITYTVIAAEMEGKGVSDECLRQSGLLHSGFVGSEGDSKNLE